MSKRMMSGRFGWSLKKNIKIKIKTNNPFGKKQTNNMPRMAIFSEYIHLPT
jgi:hypothetical protein